MAGNNGGPWGGGGGRGPGGGDDDDRNRPNGGRPTQGGSQIPEIDELMNRGRERLRVLMGGGNGNGPGGPGRGGGGEGPKLTRGTVGLGALVVVGLWAFSSFYTVRPEELSVELFLGECIDPCIGQPGLNFAPWPLVTHEVVQVTREQVIDIGDDDVPQTLAGDRTAQSLLDADTGLMLTGDENVIDIGFQVVWNITRPDMYLFNLASPEETIRAVAESAMREIIARSELGNVNREREVIGDQLQALIQSTLDSYDAGVNIVRVNIDEADPPDTRVEVNDAQGNIQQTSPLAAYRDVQDASQERVQLQNEADAYANRVTAQARGTAAQILEGAEGYRARVVNEAEGDASRFLSVLSEYRNAPSVTRQRLYLEMIEDVLGPSEIILLDQAGGGSDVVPYLPLDQVRRNTATTTGGGN